MFVDDEKAFEKKLKAKHPVLFKLLLEPRIPDVPMWSIHFGFECGPGWYPLLEELCEKIQLELNNMDDPSQFYVTQIKEKFGGLRFYMNRFNNKIDSYISKAEEKASKTCEHCSAPGTIENIGNWLNCFCPSCKEIRRQEIKNE